MRLKNNKYKVDFTFLNINYIIHLADYAVSFKVY